MGRAVCDLLEANGKYGLLRLCGPGSAGAAGPDRTGNECFRADLTNAGELQDVLGDVSDFDAVVHAAGLAHLFGRVPEEQMHAVNAHGTANIARLSLARGVSDFVQISSVSVYGHTGKASDGDGPLNEESACRPKNAYARSKLAAENVLREIYEGKRTRVSVLRLATVTGPHDPGNILRLITTIDAGRFIWVGKGLNRKSLVDREDVARAVSLILEQGAAEMPPAEGSFEVYNLSGGTLEMRRIVDLISETLGRKVPRLHFPEKVPEKILQAGAALGSGRAEKLRMTLKKWVSDDAYSAEKFAERYGFVPSKDPAGAVREEVLWYMHEKERDGG